MANKYSKAQNEQLIAAALDVLEESPIALTISDICVRRPSLAGQTSQKMSRILNELIEYGFVRKSVNKQTKRMMYMSVNQLTSQGYEDDSVD
jgi:DNA-binding IclR family transcriptional regulator